MSLTLLSVLVTPAAASATSRTYHPDTTSDPAPNGCSNGTCSLREAVIAANHHPGDDRIVLAGGKVYRLQLGVGGTDEQGGDLDVDEDLSIAPGGRKRATIKAKNSNRILQVSDGIAPPPRAHLGLSDLTLKGGIASDGGGAVENFGTTIVRGGVFVDNQATGGAAGDGGAIYSSHRLTVTHSRFMDNAASGDGGAIASFGRARIDTSTIGDYDVPALYPNSAEGFGGGVFIGDFGKVSISRSTFAGNHAGTSGGGIDNRGGELHVVNSTIFYNSADGWGAGIDSFENATSTLNAVSIVDNFANADQQGGETGGGIQNGGATYHTANSLIVANSTSGGPGPDCYGDLGSKGHNLLTSGADCTGLVASDRIRPFSEIQIGAFGNHGGPTKTVPLKKGSPAIDHAGASTPLRDQRGVKRQDPDIGAYERR